MNDKLTKPLLQCRHLFVRFGGLYAVRDVSLSVCQQEIVGLVGTNGAGKSTVLNAISGFCPPTDGQIVWCGVPAQKKDAVWYAKNGVVRTFQTIRLFEDMTVWENVAAALDLRYPYSFFDAVLGDRKKQKTEEKIKQLAYLLLKKFSLSEEAGKKAGSLPYGKKRRLELARAVAMEPKLLLLDEPAAGMNEQERDRLMIDIKNLAASMAVLVIEHDLRLIKSLCSRAYVMDQGRIIASGTPSSVFSLPQVTAAYLGQ